MYKDKIVTQIVAVNNKGYIGKDDKLMWHNPEDLQHFKETTLWNVLVVGRKTYDALPKAVHKGRVLIPISRSGNSVEEALEKASEIANNNTIFVIGGGEIYKETTKYTDFIIVSRIDDDQIGDVKFEIPEGFDLGMTDPRDTFNIEVYDRDESTLDLFMLANGAQDNARVSTAFDYNMDVDITFDSKE